MFDSMKLFSQFAHKKGNLAGKRLGLLWLLWLFQTRALMCDVYVHNDMAMQQSLRLTGGRSLGSQDSRRPRHPPTPCQIREKLF